MHQVELYTLLFWEQYKKERLVFLCKVVFDLSKSKTEVHPVILDNGCLGHLDGLPGHPS